MAEPSRLKTVITHHSKLHVLGRTATRILSHWSSIGDGLHWLGGRSIMVHLACYKSTSCCPASSRPLAFLSPNSLPDEEPFANTETRTPER